VGRTGVEVGIGVSVGRAVKVGRGVVVGVPLGSGVAVQVGSGVIVGPSAGTIRVAVQVAVGAADLGIAWSIERARPGSLTRVIAGKAPQKKQALRIAVKMVKVLVPGSGEFKA
jgi:hypothetical protein